VARTSPSLLKKKAACTGYLKLLSAGEPQVLPADVFEPVVTIFFMDRPVSINCRKYLIYINLLGFSVRICIMHHMRILIVSMAIVVLVMFSGAYSFLDAHVFAWIPSGWIEFTQTTVVLIGMLSIVAYATLYVFFAIKHTDKQASK
jgi:hypothetical protein